MSRPRTLRAQLRLVFRVLLAAVALVGVAGVAATTVTAHYVEQATSEVGPAIDVNDAILQSLTDMQTGVRGYMLSGREDVLEPYRQGLRRLPDQRARLRRLLADDPAGRRLFGAQAATIDRWVHGYAVPRVEVVGPGRYYPARFQRAQAMFERVRAQNAATEAHLKARVRALRREADDVRGLMTAGVVVATFLALAAGVLTIRSTARRVRRPVDGIRDALTALISGEHDARAAPDGPREVVTIARAVNALADETERLREVEAEDRRAQERLLEFGRQVRGILDPDEVVRRGLAELGETLRLGRAYVRLVEDGELQEVAHQWCAPGVEELTDVPTPGSTGVMRAIHRRRSPLTSTDVRQDRFFATDRGRAWADRTGARGSMTLTIPVGDAPVGVITCMDFAPRAWSGREIQVAESVAADLGRALQHANLYTAQVEAVHRLEALDRAKDEFLSTVSHELRTPLTSINGYVELLEDDDVGPVSAQQRRLLAVVRRNVDRLRVLIEDLLTLSRIESGAFRSALRPLDLAALVRACVEDMRPQADAGGVDVHVQVPGRAVPVRGDEGQLSRAVLNLIGNAIKFTPAGGRLDVEVRVEPVGGTGDGTGDGTGGDAGDGPRDAVVVEVRDTGIGIPEDDVGQVFTRFFRASNAVSSEVPGTGLGLVIVRTIVDNHGGSLDLSSTPGVGTTVRIRVPVARETAGIARGA
jgi:two-component system, OmpR family, phosphate regulon sensor histidine kinase PhoR